MVVRFEDEGRKKPRNPSFETDKSQPKDRSLAGNIGEALPFIPTVRVAAATRLG
jgi:hypothetical protein